MAKQVEFNNSCGCKRMVWQPDWGYHWCDTKTGVLWGDHRCGTCQEMCYANGNTGGKHFTAVIYDDVVAPRYDGWTISAAAKDLMDRFKSLPKENKVSLKDVVKELLASLLDNSPASMRRVILWGENGEMMYVADMFRLLSTGNKTRIDIWDNKHKPTWADACGASLVIHVTGTLADLHLEVQKNRYGTCKHYICSALEKPNSKTFDFVVPLQVNFTTKETTVNKYSYAECFSILRTAKKDGVIDEWGICSKQIPYAWVFVSRETPPYVSFYEKNGKGDIDVLSEAAEYVKQLRKKMKPDVDTMTAELCSSEIRESHYWTPAKGNHPTDTCSISLQLICDDKTHTGLFMGQYDPHESLLYFLRRCVSYIRQH